MPQAQLLQALPDAAVLTDSRGVVRGWNDAATRLFGWTAGEMVGRPLVERFPLSARAQVDEHLRQIAAGSEWDGEFEDYRKDRSRVLLEAHWHPVRDGSGAVTGILGVSRPISSERAATIERERNDQYAADILNSMSAHVAVLGPDGRILEVNRAWERFAQENAPDKSGLPTSDIGVDYVRLCRACAGKNSDEAVLAADGIEEVLQGKRSSFVLEYPCDSPTEPRWFAMHVTPLSTRGGGAVVAHYNVTTRRLTEARLREQEMLVREAADLTHVGGWGFDPVTLQSDWTPEVARIYGLDPDAPPPVTSALEFFSPEQRPALEAALAAAIRDGIPHDLELQLTAVGGEKKWVRTICRPIVEDGRVVRVRGSLQDITDRRRLEEQFRQAQKMEAVGQLASGVAHDFNNLLTVINGYIEILLTGMPVSDVRRDPLTQVLEAGQRATALTSQLLAFSRKAMVEPQILDVNQVVESSARLLSRLIGEDVRLETKLASVPAVKIDLGQLEQVFLNLAVNARDAMPGGGRLSISTDTVELPAAAATESDLAAPGPYVRLTVSDSGIGMTPEVRSHIFEPFFTTKGTGKGTGLGLATVYGIVRQAGGAITVESEPGAGTTFRILLPAMSELPTGSKSAVIDVAPRGTETVLIAEDADGVRNLARRVLETQGYTVLVARDGAEAARLAADYPGPIELLVTDVVMPDFGGRALAEEIRRRRPLARVLYMSGYTDDTVIRTGVEAAKDWFIQKPFTPLSLARRVRKVIDGPTDSPCA